MNEKRVQRIIDISSDVVVIFVVMLMIAIYKGESFQLNGFNFLGQETSDTPINIILGLGILMLFLHFVMGILNRYPSIFNYPIKLREEHEASIHVRAQRFLASIRLVTNILFLFVIFLELYQNKLLLIPVVVILIFYPIIIISFVRRIKNRNR